MTGGQRTFGGGEIQFALYGRNKSRSGSITKHACGVARGGGLWGGGAGGGGLWPLGCCREVGRSPKCAAAGVWLRSRREDKEFGWETQTGPVLRGRQSRKILIEIV